MNLLEQYKQRLDVSEKWFQNSHAGQRLDGTKKLAIATCLNNINKYLTESSWGAGQATQAGTVDNGLGTFKKFCLNVTTLGLPNTIAPEIVLTKPMTSMTGFVSYTDFVAADEKGGVQEGQLFNGAYGLGAMNEDRMRYTSARVVENFDGGAAGLTEVKVAWTPVAEAYKEDGTQVFADAEGVLYDDAALTTKVTVAASATLKIKYVYDNVVIPQNKLVHLRAIQHGIPLRAKCRRIAVNYSQIAAFQAKTDYNMDLPQQLVAQASGELAYEIDAEVVDLLDKASVADARLTFSRTQPIGVSLRDHFEAFSRVLAVAQAIIYKRTQKYQPNYMVCAADCLDVLSMNSQFRPAATGAVYGPYFAGTFGSLKVYVSPMLDAGKFIIGVNGTDLSTSAAIYAPYMPILPTQLLGLPDGTMTQGFATMYDLKLLARATSINGDVITLDYDADGCTLGEYSPLLVTGQITD